MADALAVRRPSRHASPMFDLEGIDHVALAVRDARRSAQWYIDVLGFEPRHEGVWNGVPLFVGKGTTALALFDTHHPNPIPRPRGSITMLHLAFRADRKSFLAAQSDLTARGIAFHFQDHEISHSIYFHDPDGHELEITTYEV